MPFYGKRRMRMVSVKPKSARKYTTPRKKYSKTPKITFAKKVNAVIARNIENKYSSTILYQAPIMTNVRVTDATVPVPSYTDTNTFFNWSAGASANNMTTISQGVAVNQRIGNKIKIKRWVIKGIIQPNDAFSNTATSGSGPATGKLINTLTGYVDIYFGKLTLNNQPPPAKLTSFYQSGATDVTPTGNTQEQLYNINRDLYKIYYHKRFKMGATNSSLTTATVGQSNDFGLTRSFGFDITKYVLKNHMLKYDEIATVALDSNMENLTLWAIFHPAVGSVGITVPLSTNATYTSDSFYELNCMSYFEYEDA